MRVYLHVPVSNWLCLFSGFLYEVPTRVIDPNPATGMILILSGLRTILIPVESLLVFYLQDGGVVVQDGQDDFVHVLSKTSVDFLLLLQSVH